MRREATGTQKEKAFKDGSLKKILTFGKGAWPDYASRTQVGTQLRFGYGSLLKATEEINIFTSPSNFPSGFPACQRKWLVPTRVEEDERFLPALLLRVPGLFYLSIMEVIS